MATDKKSTTTPQQQKPKHKRQKLQTLIPKPIPRSARLCETCGILYAYEEDVLCFDCRMIQERTNEHYQTDTDPDTATDFNIDDF